MNIAANLAGIRDTVKKAAQRCKRAPEQIRIMAVTKNRSPGVLRGLLDTPLRLAGENRVQEALEKQAFFAEHGFELHMIGHLQTNKVKKILPMVTMVQSLDSLKLAAAIDKTAEELGRTCDVLVQVNSSGEESKFGIDPDGCAGFTASCASYENLRIRGLMTIGNFAPDPEEVRPCFRIMKELFDDMKNHERENVRMDMLSMGMTNDYEVAVEEGSTLLRIGSALFA